MTGSVASAKMSASRSDESQPQVGVTRVLLSLGAAAAIGRSREPEAESVDS